MSKADRTLWITLTISVGLLAILFGAPAMARAANQVPGVYSTHDLAVQEVAKHYPSDGSVDNKKWAESLVRAAEAYCPGGSFGDRWVHSNIIGEPGAQYAKTIICPGAK